MATRIGLTFLLAVLFVIAGSGDQPDPRGMIYTVHATVESVNLNAQSIRISQEKIDGYSAARIATYNVDDAAILQKLEPGDRVDATIYAKDDTLYNIHIVVIDDRVRIPRR